MGEGEYYYKAGLHVGMATLLEVWPLDPILVVF